MRIPINQGIAGYVASTGEKKIFVCTSSFERVHFIYFQFFYFTGETLNIKDAYSHHLFYREVDYKTGFKTK